MNLSEYLDLDDKDLLELICANEIAEKKPNKVETKIIKPSLRAFIRTKMFN